MKSCEDGVKIICDTPTIHVLPRHNKKDTALSDGAPIRAETDSIFASLTFQRSKPLCNRWVRIVNRDVKRVRGKIGEIFSS